MRPDLLAMATPDRVRSAHHAAMAGLYEYSPVRPEQFRPYKVEQTHVTTRRNEFLLCPAGTTLHLSPSVTCWRVTGYVLPLGQQFLLTAT